MDDIIKLKAIVVKSTPYSDNDKMLTVLSDARGVMSVSAKGVKSLKNKNSAAANALCFSEMVLKPRGDIYSLSSADVIESFYPLREDVSALSFGMYFAQLAAMCVGEGSEAGEELSLLLNTLFVLSKYPGRCGVLCAAFELKLCEMEGVTPIVGRCSCGCESGYFDVEQGESFCEGCRTPSSLKVSQSALRVMEYVLNAPLKDALLFDTPRGVCEEVRNITERFMLVQFGKLPKILEYIKEIEKNEGEICLHQAEKRLSRMEQQSRNHTC